MEEFEKNSINSTKLTNEEIQNLINDTPSNRWMSKLKKWKIFIKLFFTTNFYGKFIIINLKEIKKHKFRYIIGFLSCFLVVLIISLLMSVISKAPIVFLMLAEAETGEIDISITSSFPNRPYINFSMIENYLKNYNLNKQYNYNSPRYQRSLSLYVASQCENKQLDPYDPKWKYLGINGWDTNCIFNYDNCFSYVCPTALPYRGSLYLIDSEREKKMNLGREWIKQYPPIEKGEVYISESLSAVSKIQEGDIIYLFINGLSFFEDIWIFNVVNTTKELIDQNKTIPDLQNISINNIYIPVKVKTIFRGSQGKIPQYDNDVLIMEYSYFLPYIIKNLNPLIPNQAVDLLKNINLYEYADEIVWNLPPPRVNYYLDSNYDDLTKKIVNYASEILYIIGFSQVYSELPILQSLKQTRYVSLFLGLILDIIIFILLLLSTLLIYSLLTIDVHQRSFEMGVLRSMGISKMRVIYILLIQAFFYAILSWAVGLVVSQIFCVIIMNFFNQKANVELSNLLTGDSILTSTLMVFWIPVFASIFPIREVLSQNVNTVLDKRRSKAKAIEYSIERTESSQRINSPILIIGFFLSLFGISIYILLPYSLLSDNLAIILYIFIFLLIGMILGLVIVSSNIDSFLATIMVYLFFFWDKESIRRILLKNMIAHKMRNKKTTIMYALSLGFIIFLSVSYSIQVQSFLYEQQRGAGTLLHVYSISPLFPITIKNELEQAAKKNPNILGTAWCSESFSSITNKNTYITNIGHTFLYNIDIYAVSSNFYDVAYEKFYIPYNGDKRSGNELLIDLYNQDKMKEPGIIIGTYPASVIGVLNNNEDLLVSIENMTSFFKKKEIYKMKPIGFLNSSPYFIFSKYPNLQRNFQDALITFSTLSNLTNLNESNIPIHGFFMKIRDNINEKEINIIKNQIMSVIISNKANGLEIHDYNQAIIRAELTENILFYFFEFSIIMAMIICFFSLMSSMYSNINEQSKEIGILRVLGTLKWWMYRIYIYEAFILIFSSSLLGIMIGCIVGYTMVLQRILFTQLPIPFIFPYFILLLIFFLSILFAFLSSWKPIQQLINQPIVQLLRE